MRKLAVWTVLMGMGVSGIAASLPEAQLVAQLGGGSSALALYDSYALVGQGRYVSVVDVSDPAYPRGITSLSLAAVVRSIFVDGTRAAVLLETQAALLDLTNPRAPKVVATRTGVFHAAAWAGDRLILLAEESFSIFQVADLGQPKLLVYYPDAGLRGRKWATVMDSRLIVASPQGLHVYDLSDPTAPRPEHHVRTEDQLFQTIPGHRVGTTVYLASGRTVHVYDFSNPTQPRRLLKLELPFPVAGLLSSGDEVLALTEDSTLFSVTPGRPEVGSPRFAPSVPVGRAVAGVMLPGWLGVLTEDHGLRFYQLGGGAGRARAQPETPRHAGQTDPNPSFDVAVRGGWAYVAAGEQGLFVFRAAGLHLAEAGRVPIPEGTARGVSLAGDWLFVAAGGAGLWTLSLANPGVPAVRGKLALPGEARTVTTQGQLAIVAAGHTGVQVIDVRDPARPKLLGQANVRGYAWDATVHGQWLLVAAGHEGLRVVDLSVPSAPREVGGLVLPGTAWAVRAADHLAYVALGFGGLAVVDVSDPVRPRLVAHLPLPGFAARLAWDGHLLFVATEWGGVRIVDLRDPTRPREVGYHTIPGGGWAKGVAPADLSLLVVGTGVHLFPFRAAAGQPPERVLPVENTFFLPPSHVVEVAEVEGILYAVDRAGISVFKPDSAGKPVFLTFVPHPWLRLWGSPRRVIAHRGHLFVLAGPRLDVWSLDPNGFPVHIGVVEAGGTDMALVEDHLYVTAHKEVLAVDVSVPARATVRARLPWPGLARSVSAAGSILLVGDTERYGVFLLRIVAPGRLEEVAFHSTRMPPYTQAPSSIVTVGNHALVGVSGRGLVVLDISDPARPREVEEVRLFMPPDRLVVGDRFLLASTPSVGVLVFDISALPRLPARWTTAGAAGSPQGVALHEGFLYAGFGEGGLAVFRLVLRTP